MIYPLIILSAVFLIISLYSRRDLIVSGIKVWDKFLKDTWYPFLKELKERKKQKRKK